VISRRIFALAECASARSSDLLCLDPLRHGNLNTQQGLRADRSAKLQQDDPEQCERIPEGNPVPTLNVAVWEAENGWQARIADRFSRVAVVRAVRRSPPIAAICSSSAESFCLASVS
jgi:hypothetical protein